MVCNVLYNERSGILSQHSNKLHSLSLFITPRAMHYLLSLSIDLHMQDFGLLQNLLLTGYTAPIKPKTASQRLDHRSASRSDKFCK